jgi:outer membrane receptor protein involved in Fe transport
MLLRPFAALPVVVLASVALAQPSQPPAPTPTVRASATVDVEATTDDETLSLGALGREADLKKSPFSMSVVSSRNLKEAGARELSDGLKGASSVNVVSGFGIFDLFVVRGFDSLTNGLVMIDGVREPESTFLPAYNIERLEILRGPGGFVSGPDAAASTVNVLRKLPSGTEFRRGRGAIRHVRFLRRGWRLRRRERRRLGCRAACPCSFAGRTATATARTRSGA